MIQVEQNEISWQDGKIPIIREASWHKTNTCEPSAGELEQLKTMFEVSHQGKMRA